MGEAFGVPFFKALVAEFIGTLLLIFIGCGAAVSALNGNLRGTLFTSQFITQVSLAFGLAVAGIVQGIGHVSGGHINPAVTFSMMVVGRMGLIHGLFYMAVQYLGGIGGAALLWVVTPGGFTDNAESLGANSLAEYVQPLQGLLMEAMVTFILVLVVFGCCDSRRDDVKGSIPLAIGLTVTVCNLGSIGISSCGLNPARTLGPAIIHPRKNLHHYLWIYFVGQHAGAAAAAVLYTFVFRVKDPMGSKPAAAEVKADLDEAKVEAAETVPTTVPSEAFKVEA